MALDTLAGVLRAMAEFALDQEEVDIATFRTQAEGWASHIALATAPPGVAPEEAKGRKGRREWESIRRFVRDYCQSSARKATKVTTDLRQVIWVFIKNLSQAFAHDQEVAARVDVQLGRLESMVETSSLEELKREIQGAVVMLRKVLEERQERQHKQMASLGEQVKSLGHELESARRESETDPLTRIANRKAFDEYLAGSVEIQKAFGQAMCLLVVDVDHFKTVNDSHGHLSGDSVLCAVADSLVKVFLRKNDFVARIGGDEFAVVLRDTRILDAKVLCDKILTRIRGLLLPMQSGETITVSVTIGLGAIHAGDDVKMWMDRADRALYAAKEAGRDRMQSEE
jgi:diguanylate cyclase (GGDEF)-like protein